MSPLTIGEIILGEICHIRARRKKGPRYDPTLTRVQVDEFQNLLLLCPTCHTVIDKNPSTYSIELLEEIKELHERAAPCEISPGVARIASLMLAHFQKSHAITNSPVSTTASVTASRGGVAISVGGHNMGGICVKTSGSGPARKQYPRNSIGADANLTNYVEYLCQLYVDYMSPTGLTAGEPLGGLVRQ